MTDIFSEAGIARWQGILANSAAFEVAASGWRGTLLLVEAGTDRSTWLKLADGSIEEARPGTVDDRDVAEFVLEASGPVWRGLSEGTAELTQAALSGNLRLVRGQVMRLLPHARAASELLKAAAAD